MTLNEVIEGIKQNKYDDNDGKTIFNEVITGKYHLPLTKETTIDFIEEIIVQIKSLDILQMTYLYRYLLINDPRIFLFILNSMKDIKSIISQMDDKYDIWSEFYMIHKQYIDKLYELFKNNDSDQVRYVEQLHYLTSLKDNYVINDVDFVIDKLISTERTINEKLLLEKKDSINNNM